jgi:hypothetical protein
VCYSPYSVVKEQCQAWYDHGRVEPRVGGDSRDRTDDLRLAKPALSQLSYIPAQPVVGLGRLELPTSRLSGVRSNQLSYRPNIPAAGPRSSLWQENSVRGLEQFRLPKVFQQGWQTLLLRKEVIQPHLPIRLPCYDLVPLINHTLGTCLPEGLAQRLGVQPTRLT